MQFDQSRNQRNQQPTITPEIREKIENALEGIYGDLSNIRIKDEHIALDLANNMAYVTHPYLNAGKVIILNLDQGVTGFQG